MDVLGIKNRKKPTATESKPVGNAMDRFKGCKGISSDQYFGREQVRNCCMGMECDV